MPSSLFEPGHLQPCESYSRHRDLIDLGLLHSLYNGGGGGVLVVVVVVVVVVPLRVLAATLVVVLAAVLPLVTCMRWHS